MSFLKIMFDACYLFSSYFFLLAVSRCHVRIRSTENQTLTFAPVLLDRLLWSWQLVVASDPLDLADHQILQVFQWHTISVKLSIRYYLPVTHYYS
jgi:hypothetical protein